MAKTFSSVTALLGRFVKIVMVVVVLSLAIGLLRAILEPLEAVSASGATVRQWLMWGSWTYIGTHLLLYRPAAMFRAGRGLFSTLAAWLFGAQVASVDSSNGGGAKGKGTKSAKGEPASQGSTLVAFSPYVVPLYTVLVCAAGWGLGRWADQIEWSSAVAFLIGVTMTFHWLMTADELQQQRARWHLETYLLAIGLVFVVTLLIAGACLPWAVPEFSFTRALADGCSRTQAVYAAIIQRLFF